jgi:hypothetical protein
MTAGPPRLPGTEGLRPPPAGHLKQPTIPPKGVPSPARSRRHRHPPPRLKPQQPPHATLRAPSNGSCLDHRTGSTPATPVGSVPTGVRTANTSRTALPAAPIRPSSRCTRVCGAPRSGHRTRGPSRPEAEISPHGRCTRRGGSHFRRTGLGRLARRAARRSGHKRERGPFPAWRGVRADTQPRSPDSALTWPDGCGIYQRPLFQVRCHTQRLRTGPGRPGALPAPGPWSSSVATSF